MVMTFLFILHLHLDLSHTAFGQFLGDKDVAADRTAQNLMGERMSEI